MSAAECEAVMEAARDNSMTRMQMLLVLLTKTDGSVAPYRIETPRRLAATRVA